MTITRFLKHNPTFTATDILSDWCQPLALLQIPYFCHVHVDHQNRLTFFCNFPEFARHYLEQGFHQFDVHMKPEFKQPQVIVWDLYERTAKSKIMHDEFKEFGRGHTFTIVKPRDDGCDYFHFAAQSGTHEINHTYMQNIDVLERYVSFYLDKLSRSPSVQKALSQRLLLNPSAGGYYLAESSAQIDCKSFYEMTEHQRHHVLSRSGYLTSSETDCLYWLAQGKSLCETAMILGISTRTVKAHIHNAKEKLECDNLFQLGMYFKDKYQLLSKMGWKPKERKT